MSEIRFDFNRMLESYLGKGFGIPETEIAAMADEAKKAHSAFNARIGDPKAMVGWTALPENNEDELEAMLEEADRIRRNFEAVVLFGIGGSALGPIAIQQALNHLHYNELPASRRPGPRFYVEDNVDPDRMSALFDIVDVKSTLFIIITKSGGTAETMSQYLLCMEKLKAAVGEDFRKHILCVTGKSGILRDIVNANGYKAFVVPDDVGGRFSELCPVGLLPAAICGIDIRGMLAGAAAMKARCASDEIAANPALMQAVLMYLATTRHGVASSVMMPYSDNLKYIADWYCQLWAESLGKAETRDGKQINAGSTPVKALGVTDQHSQLQLYSEGPFDKVVTFIKVENFHETVVIPDGKTGIERIDFLANKTFNALIHAEFDGTEYALVKCHRMSEKILMPTVNAYTIGQLLYFFELTTAYMGELLGIDAFNQPGVETSKVSSYAVLGNRSTDKYVAMAKEMEQQPAAKAEFLM